MQTLSNVWWMNAIQQIDVSFHLWLFPYFFALFFEQRCHLSHFSDSDSMSRHPGVDGEFQIGCILIRELCGPPRRSQLAARRWASASRGVETRENEDDLHLRGHTFSILGPVLMSDQEHLSMDSLQSTRSDEIDIPFSRLVPTILIKLSTANRISQVTRCPGEAP